MISKADLNRAVIAITWEDVERLALQDPTVHKAVELVRLGIPREGALINAVCELFLEKARLIEANAEIKANMPRLITR